MPFAATWTDLEVFILSEISLKKKPTIWYHLYMESKIWHKWTYWQTEIDSQRADLWLQGGGKGRGETDWELGVS